MTTGFELRFAAHQTNALRDGVRAGGMLRSEISQSLESGDEEVAEWRLARFLGAAACVAHEPLKHRCLPLWKAESGKQLRSVLADESRQREPVVDAR
jgi:hypothetical protein